MTKLNNLNNKTMENKPHGFCETPEENCTMNYCDDNGCQNRKRVLLSIELSSDLAELTNKYQEVKAENERLKNLVEVQKNYIMVLEKLQKSI